MTKTTKQLLAEVVLNFEQPKLNANNPHFKSKYITLSAVINSINTQIKKIGLFYRQEITKEDDQLWVNTIISSENGEDVSVKFPYTNDPKPQNQGSALTYARRYCLCLAFGVAPDEDDDGNASSNNVKPVSQTKKGNAELVESLLSELKKLLDNGIINPKTNNIFNAVEICEGYKVKSLNELNVKQLEQVINIIKRNANHVQK